MSSIQTHYNIGVKYLADNEQTSFKLTQLYGPKIKETGPQLGLS